MFCANFNTAVDFFQFLADNPADIPGGIVLMRTAEQEIGNPSQVVAYPLARWSDRELVASCGEALLVTDERLADSLRVDSWWAA